jgi:NitT/TauT family transport system permease protein
MTTPTPTSHRRRSPGVRRGIALVLLLSIWESLSRVGWLDPFYFPPPSAVASVLFELVADGELWPHLGATAIAAFAGLIVGLGLGVALGFAAALSPIVAELLEPVMILLNAIPRVILAPLFVIWLGIGLASKLALATILVMVLIFFSVYNGIKEVDQRLVERVRTLGGGRRVLIREVYVPSVTAWVMGNFKVAVGFAFTGAVVGEFVASSRGLGYLLQFAQSTYNAALTIALILVIMVVVLLLFALSERLERRLLAWRQP